MSEWFEDPKEFARFCDTWPIPEEEREDFKRFCADGRKKKGLVRVGHHLMRQAHPPGGHLRWLPKFVTDAIVTVWNFTSCILLGHGVELPKQLKDGQHVYLCGSCCRVTKPCSDEDWNNWAATLRGITS